MRLVLGGGRERTAAVADNVFSLRVRIDLRSAWPREVVWLAGDGSRIRTVSTP